MNKKLLGIFAGILAISLVFAGAVYYQAINVDITVDEALSATPISISVTGAYPGEVITRDITIANAAGVPLYTTLTWAEGTNAPGITYITGGALTGVSQVAANGNTVLTVSFTIEEDTPLGTFDGVITLERVAAP